jgi:cysteine desulfurase
MERARAQVAEAAGAQAADIVFVSGRRKRRALALAGRGCTGPRSSMTRSGLGDGGPAGGTGRARGGGRSGRDGLQAANSETGILQDLPEGLAVSDWTQAFGKVPMAFDWSGVDMALISAHKIGGPKGIGALILRARAGRGGAHPGRRAGDGAPVGHREPDRDCRIWGCGSGCHTRS